MFALILLSVLCAVGIILIAIECWKVYVNHTKLKKFVVAKGLPFLGNIIDLLKCDNEQIINFPDDIIMKNNIDCNAKSGFTWMGPVLIMFSHDPDIYEHILNSDKCLRKGYPYRFLRNTQGIFTSEPKIWKAHRKALNPTLGPKMVNSFIPIFNEKFKIMVDLMERQLDTSVNMHPIAFKAAMDTIFSASFDVNWPLQNHKGDEVRQGIIDMFERVQLRFHSVLMKWDAVYRFTKFYQLDNIFYPKFNHFVKSALEVKKIDLAEKLNHGNDELAKLKETNSFNFLQKCLQLEHEQKFNDKDIYEEMATILIGSIDTSAITISGIILMLAIHQDYQDRVVDELRSIYNGVDDPVTKEHLSMMRFMELVIKESLRHFPIAPFLARETTEDIPLADGVIPKGTTIVLNIYKTNRNPKFWGENAREFYPERFLPEHSKDYHPYQYIPFSAGPRNCIGIRYAWASLKIALAYLLRRYKFTTDLKMHEVRVKTGLILKIVNEDPVRIERREW